MDALLIVPPFADSRRASLAVHLLQACARRAGFDVEVLYANLWYAHAVGERRYLGFCGGLPINALLGEHLFSSAAFGLAPLSTRIDVENCAVHPSDLRAMEAETFPWVEHVAQLVAQRAPRVVGCTTTLEQTAASCALMRRLRVLMPEALLILGGANCDGEMARGIASLDCGVDYIFSGESETTFVEFLRTTRAGHRPPDRILEGRPCMDLDALPTPDYSAFFEQRIALGMPDPPGGLTLLYESSRGCWWGQKHHCTFCGMNGSDMVSREKSADRVLSDLKHLLGRHPVRKVLMTDNIMPRSYFRTLLPRLRDELPHARLFYEQKSNMRLDEVMTLREAGVVEMQPGIEALSTALLQRMRKGVSGPQNLALLRNARSIGVSLLWNLLYAFPGDRLEDYEETVRLLPLLHHLQPPAGPFAVNIDRFSPYFEQADGFGIRDLRPVPAYATAFPTRADVGRLACHFEAEYTSASLGRGTPPPLLKQLEEETARWRSRWSDRSHLPVLEVRRYKGGPLQPSLLVLRDTRGLPHAPEVEILSAEQARLLLTPSGKPAASAEMDWALARGAAVHLEGTFVPLATASPSLLREFGALGSLNGTS